MGGGLVRQQLAKGVDGAVGWHQAQNREAAEQTAGAALFFVSHWLLFRTPLARSGTCADI